MKGFGFKEGVLASQSALLHGPELFLRWSCHSMSSCDGVSPIFNRPGAVLPEGVTKTPRQGCRELRHAEVSFYLLLRRGAAAFPTPLTRRRASARSTPLIPSVVSSLSCPDRGHHVPALTVTSGGRGVGFDVAFSGTPFGSTPATQLELFNQLQLSLCRLSNQLLINTTSGCGIHATASRPTQLKVFLRRQPQQVLTQMG